MMCRAFFFAVVLVAAWARATSPPTERCDSLRGLLPVIAEQGAYGGNAKTAAAWARSLSVDVWRRHCVPKMTGWCETFQGEVSPGAMGKRSRAELARECPPADFNERIAREALLSACARVAPQALQLDCQERVTAQEAEDRKPVDASRLRKLLISKPAEREPGHQVAAPSSRPLTGPVTVMGSLDQAEVNRVVQEHSESIRACLVAAKGSLSARIKWVIAPDGSVKAADLLQSNLGAGETRCILKEVATWRFSAPKAGGVAIVSSELRWN